MPVKNLLKNRHKKSLVMGEKWLRVLAEDPYRTDEPAWECPNCGIIWPIRDDACRACGGRLEEVNWAIVNYWIQTAIRYDPQVIARVKAEREGWASPENRNFATPPRFSGRFEWLKAVWEGAGKPRGRPFEPYRYFDVFRWIRMKREIRDQIKNEHDPDVKKKMTAYLEEIEKELEKACWNKNPRTATRIRYLEDAYGWGIRYLHDVKFRLSGERPGQRGVKRKKR
jgi:hypothetical protein